MESRLGTFTASVNKDFFFFIFLSRQTIKTMKRSNAMTRMITTDTKICTGGNWLLGANVGCVERVVKWGVVGGGGAVGGAVPSTIVS